MKTVTAVLTFACMAFGAPAFAEFQQITSRTQFVSLMDGKTLTRPLIKINVQSDGNISGTGASWPVTGTWQWKGEYLCRSLVWGGDDLGYNCQEVKAYGNKVRITSDKGAGRSADFRLR